MQEIPIPAEAIEPTASESGPDAHAVAATGPPGAQEEPLNDSPEHPGSTGESRRIPGERRNDEDAGEHSEADDGGLLSRLCALAERVGLAADDRGVYRALFEFCIPLTAADAFTAVGCGPAGAGPYLYAARLAEGAVVEQELASLPRQPGAESPQSRAILSGETVVGPPVPEAARQAGRSWGRGEANADGRICVAVPLKVRGRPIGAVELSSARPDSSSDSCLSALAMAASYAAIALERVGMLERERAQRMEAEASERRLRELLDRASDGIVVFEPDGTIRQTNPTMRSLMGVSEEAGELDGRRVGEWLPELESEGRSLPSERSHGGRTQLSERRLRRNGSEDLAVETNTRQLADGTFLTVVRDISERKRTAEALLEEKLLSDAIIDSLPGLFYLFDEDLRPVRWNDNVTTVTGYGADEIPHMTPLDFIDPDERSYLLERVVAVLQEGHATATAKLITKAGERIPYFFSSVRLMRQGRMYVIGSGIDISQQQLAEERIRQLNAELERRLARLSALHEIDMAITGSVDLHLTLGVVLTKLVNELEVQGCSVWLHDKADGMLERAVSEGVPPRAGDAGAVRLGEGPVGRCGSERQRIRLSGADPELAWAPGLADYLAVPLVSKGQLQGVLELFAASPLGASEDWFEFLEALALQTAIAIDNAQLFEGLQRSAAEITLAYDATIEGWARALDLRDHETEGHSRRVTELTVMLARHMGVVESELAHIRRGALLHDIGKLGVPDAILAKPGDLSAREREVIERHASFGYELLAPIDFLRPTIDIPYSHHEAWDGSGYPRGLSGDEIPLPARIFAVADVFDALVSDRPYRAAWPVERALEYLHERAGSQFDPKVVRAFLELFAERGATPGDAVGGSPA